MQTATPKPDQQSSEPSRQSLRFISHPRLVFAIALGTAIATIVVVTYPQFRTKSAAQPAPLAPTINAITALGRLEPQGEVVSLTASNQGSRIARLLVKQGDRVQAGQVIAVLDSHDRLQAAVEKANRQVQVAQTQLAQVQAGAKTGEVSAQKATIERIQAQLRDDVTAKQAAVARLEAEVRNAQQEYQRYESLYRDGAVSASLRDGKRLTLDAALQELNEAKATRSQTASTLTQQVKEARATLDQIAEVRPVDVRVAQAEVDSAIAAVQQAQAELDLSYIKAPRAGQILKIHTWAGEIVDSTKGIVSLGQTDQMYAVAEVYESDIHAVHRGQPAKITSTSLSTELQGIVDEVGLEVAKKDVLNTDPAADVDARVVEVKIRLNRADSQKVAGLTNLKVKVAIQPRASS